MSTEKTSKNVAYTGLFAAIAASSCCIPPVIALIAGVVWYYVHKHNSEKNNGAGCADCSIFTDEMKCEGAFCQWDGNACICPTNKDCTKQCPNFTDKNSCHDAKCEWVDKGSGPVCTGDKNDCRS